VIQSRFPEVGAIQAKDFAELDGARKSAAESARLCGKDTLTLLYSSHDAEHNNAVALKGYIEGDRSKS
jgi:uncharacterized protein YeaO (DUF488 family)